LSEKIGRPLEALQIVCLRAPRRLAENLLLLLAPRDHVVEDILCVSPPNAAVAIAYNFPKIALGGIKFRLLHFVRCLLPECCFLLPELGERLVAHRLIDGSLFAFDFRR
jgi:hypothetical protein